MSKRINTTPGLEVEGKNLSQIIRDDYAFEEKVQEVLEFGKQYLGADSGHFTRIDVETGHWRAVVSTTPPGQYPENLELDLRTTYCRHAVETDSLVSICDAPEQGLDDDAAFETTGLRSYQGVPVIINGDVYGTVCFVAKTSREPLSDGERLVVELIGQLLERELQRERRETQLTRQTNLTSVLNRVLRHNLRNSMNVIRGSVNMMVEQADDGAYSEAVFDQIDQLIDLSEKARDLDRIVTAEFDYKSIDVTRTLNDVVKTVRQNHPGVSITVEPDVDIAVAAMPTFRRALQELVENAAKHAGDTPTVTISVSSTSNAVEIRISDDGPGLEGHEIDALQAGKETQLAHGNGLGLWLSYWIVTSHDGSIEAAVTDEGTRMTVCIPRKQTPDAEDELTELTQARDRYRAAFETANDAIVIVDDDARIIDANPEAGALYGFDREELLGQPLHRFFPDDIEFDNKWRKFRSGNLQSATETLVRSDGVERRVEYSATADVIPGQHLIVSRDVTDRERQKRTLTAMKERYRTLLEAAPDPVFVADAETGKFIEVNEAAETLLGVSSKEILGRPVTEFHPSEQSEQYRDLFEETIRDDKTKRQLPDGAQIYVVTDSGEQVPVEISFASVSLPEQSVIFGIIRDISEQRERKAKLRSKTRAIDRAPLGITLSDPNEDGNPFVYANERFRDLTGYGDSAIGRNYRHLHGKNTDPEAAARVEQAISAETPVGETLRNHREDGTPFWNRMTIAPVTDETGDLTRWVYFHEDVTERVERRQALQQTTQQLDAVVNASPSPIVAVDTDGHVTLWNDAADSLFGHDDGDAVGQRVRDLDLFRAGTGSELQACIERTLNGETVQNVELEHRNEDGERLTFSVSTAPLRGEADEISGGVVIARDITERRDAEQENESIIRRYKALLDAAPDPVFLADIETGKILEANEAAEELTGKSKERLVGSHQSTLHPTGKGELYREAFERGVNGQETVRALSDGSQLELTTAGGGTVPIEISASRVSLPDGDVMFGIFRDMQLKRKTERLETVASVLSHDLRNPLTVAQGRLGLLAEEFESEHLDHIEHAHNRIETLITDVLTLARNGEPVGETEAVALSDLVNSCWQGIETEDATLVVETDQTIRADTSRLQQLLENLFRNSIDHGGTDVTVTVRDLDDGFTIADDGPGIQVDERTRIFDSGYSTTTDGTGFGLSIVQDIATAHDWNISVGDSDSGGARFEITGVVIDAESRIAMMDASAPVDPERGGGRTNRPLATYNGVLSRTDGC